jgi:hypothetical protein
MIQQGFRESEVEIILCACEAYGRFALHKEAYQQNHGVAFSAQAKVLLDWTTEKVIPALNKRGRSGEYELRDLDLSRISNASDSIIIHGSPSPVPKRANLRSTPQRLDGKSASLYDNDRTLSEPAVFLVSAVAESLLTCSCTIFSEWLAVGGGLGAAEIDETAANWCQIFEKREDEEDHDRAEEVKKAIMPAFIRLAFELCKCSDNFLLLKKLLVHCNELDTGDSVSEIKKALSLLLADRSTQDSKREGVIESVLDAANDLLDGEETDLSVELPATVDDLWSNPKGFISSALSIIMGNRQASLALARRLVAKLGMHVGDVTTKTIFETKCLWLVIEESDCGTEMGKVVRELDAERFEEGGELRVVIHKLLNSNA